MVYGHTQIVSPWVLWKNYFQKQMDYLWSTVKEPHNETQSIKSCKN